MELGFTFGLRARCTLKVNEVAVEDKGWGRDQVLERALGGTPPKEPGGLVGVPADVAAAVLVPVKGRR